MKQLSEYIKDEFIKNKFFENSIYVKDVVTADSLAYDVSIGKIFNVVFDNFALKEHFFDTLSSDNRNLNIINCNSTIDRFFENDFSGLLVFDNIKKCKDSKILEEIKKYKAILIC